MKWPGYLLLYSISVCPACSIAMATGMPGDTVAGETGRAPRERADIFSSDEPMDMTLCFNISQFLKSKKEPVFIEAKCMIGAGKDTAVKTIKLKARGEMRRAYCHFPPILLKFGDNEKDSFPVEGSLKLVVPCMPTDKYETYVLKEYLTYRLFNQVTSYSLRTRLVRLRLIDSDKPSKSYTAFGFLIENDKKMAQRNNAIVIKNESLTQRHMNPEDISRIALFNFMIGNTDWSVPLQHNIKVLKSKSALSEKGIPVAYDFDYAGLVNPPYAAPAKDLPITEVRERYYLGICDNSQVLVNTIEEFEELKGNFMTTINECEYLSVTDRKYSQSYIENFYRMYKNRNSMLNTVNRTCKQ